MKKISGVGVLALGLVMGFAAASSQAQDVTGDEVAESDGDSPFYQGTYFAPMISYLRSDGDPIDNGYGGVLAAGYRKNWYALEFTAAYHQLPSKTGKDARELGGTVGGLLFPFSSSPNLFLIAQAGGTELKNYATPPTVERIALTTFAAGVGDLLKLSVGDYEFAVRAEVLYRHGIREKNQRPASDLDAPRNFNDLLVNVGLQLPIGKKKPPPAPVPVIVVPTAAVCGDGIDNDGDGVIDYPADSGCSSADDGDETNAPACSDGLDNDADGAIDFPSDKGCTAVDDADETDPCRGPAAGEKVSLKGCGTGDVIVLRGVNFEFDKARLTVNAKTILDGVADELIAYPDIRFELGGHTDAKGSDEYNQRLSEERAVSVMTYLKSKGIAEDRMASVGFGEAQPVADNETDEGRELNRRVELKITGGGAAASVKTISPLP